MLLTCVLMSLSSLGTKKKIKEKIVSECVFNLLDDKDKLCEKTRYEKYDKKGNIIEIGEYGETWREIEHITLENGTTQKISTLFQDFKRLNTVEYLQYDNQNRKQLSERWRFRRNIPYKKLDSTAYYYNQNGELQFEIKFDFYDTPIKSDTIYNYGPIDKEYLDSVGRITERTIQNESEFFSKYIDHYNAQNLIVKREVYRHKPDSLVEVKEWIYNELNLIIQFKEFDLKSDLKVTTYNYNKWNLLISQYTIQKNRLTRSVKYKYKFYR